MNGMAGMTGPASQEPVEERLADRLDAGEHAAPVRSRTASLLRRLGGYDRAAYRAVAQMSTRSWTRR